MLQQGFNPVYAVSGTLTPDATGNYGENGTINGRMSYVNEAGTYYIYWTGAEYILGNNNDGTETVVWIKVGGTDPAGSYMADAGATGTATVTAV